MLHAYDAVPMIAVKDLAVGRRFYTKTLGFEVIRDEGEEVLQLKSGKTMLNVYRSASAGTNQATAVMWDVGKELPSLVRALRQKDVPFMHYDLPGLTREGDLHVSGDFKMAWFKDPDGNILALMGS